MKNLVFILFGIFLLIAYSCQKEDISPRAHDNYIEFNDTYEDDLPMDGNALGAGRLTSDKASDSLNPITDPNRDEDDNKKIKAKRSR